MAKENKYQIEVTREISFDQIHYYDQDEFPELENQRSIIKIMKAIPTEKTLVIFHLTTPIKILEDFEIECKRYPIN